MFLDRNVCIINFGNLDEALKKLFQRVICDIIIITPIVL